MEKEAGAMKSLFLLISNLEGGGAQRVVSTLSAGLSGHYQVKLILHDAGRTDYDYQGEIVDLGTPVASAAPGKALFFIRRVFKLRKLRKVFKPAAVISFLESSNFVNLFAGGSGKTILSVRNYKSKQGKTVLGRLFHLLIKLFYRKSDLVVVPSEGIKKDLENNFNLAGEKLKVIHNPYNLKYIRQRAREDLTDGETSYYSDSLVITVGSLTRQKGHWHLIRAFAEVKKELPGVKLLILGEGSLRPYLERLALDSGLEKDLFMPGFKENPFKFISRSSIFVLPSLFEGFPNVLVEAMACGVPAAATDCPSGPREILAPGSGFQRGIAQMELSEYGILLPVCDGTKAEAGKPLSKEEQVMAGAIIKLLKNDQLRARYGEQSRCRAGDFALDQVADQWINLIEGSL